MRVLPDDVRFRLDRDFTGDARARAEAILLQMNERLTASTGFADHARVTRCAVHIAQGDLARLVEAADLACLDWRDVIMWAEYDRDGRRLHDFVEPFD